MFLIRIWDIDTELGHKTASAFADDTSVVMKVGTADNVMKIQEDLERIYGWAEVDNTKFNVSKSLHLRYGSTQEPTAAYFAPDVSMI